METGTIINFAIFAFLAWFMYSRIRPAKGLKTLNYEDFKRKMEATTKRMVIDVREIGEYNSGYIAGAKNIPLSQLSRRLGEIPKDQEILIYCRSGMRSKNAAKILLKKGYTDLAHLQGGLNSWSGKLTQK